MTESQFTDGICISTQNLSKKFCKNLRRSMLYGLIDIAKGTFGIRSNSQDLRKDEFWALDNVSFELKKGEVLGVIGPNGSGKTTLLRLLAKIFPPDKGVAVIQGRVATLLTIGAGFHPHMTVQENMYINGTILGMSSKEIDEKYQSIINFSGIRDFEKAPVAALSDGMYLRLGFSIAIAMEPDIYLIDEVLSMGDKEFRNKCIEEIKRISQRSSVVFVSHNMEMTKKVCNRVIVMNKGKKVYESRDAPDGIEYYNSIQKV